MSSNSELPGDLPNPSTSQTSEISGNGAPQGGFSVRLARSGRSPVWRAVAPFFLSALFYISGVFSLFSPLPLLLLAFQFGRKWLWLAALTNCAIVFFFSGNLSLWLYLIFVVSLAISLAIALKPGRSLERACGITLGTMMASALAIVLIHSQVHHTAAWPEFKRVVFETMDEVVKSLSPESRTNLLGENSLQDWKNQMLFELPSAVGVLSILLVWINLFLCLRTNPAKLRERLGLEPGYYRKWKAPEIFLWPTIIAGFFLVKDWGTASSIALIFFKLIMSLYALQGLSVLSFFFQSWGLRGLIRTMAYLLAVILMLPLLLSIGFFDQWFDFRAKLRQS